MGLIIPEEIESVFQRADDPSLPLDELHLPTEFSKAIQVLKEAGKEQHVGEIADFAAWRFSRSEGERDEPWGLYWTPLASKVMENGTTIYYPDIAQLDDDILAHWIHRASTAKHPVIGARYADLAWTIGGYLRRPVENRSVCPAPQTKLDIPVSLAHNAIDHYLTAVERDLSKDEYHAWFHLERAIELAVLLNDKNRIARAKSVLYAYQAKCAGSKPKYLWWRLDQIVSRFEKRLDISPDEMKALMDGLYKVLSDSSNQSNKEMFDPHAAQAAADRIIERLGNDQPAIQAIVRQAGDVYEKAAETQRGLVAMAWLEDLAQRYDKLGLKADAVRVERAVKARSAEALSEMRSISVPFDVTEEELNAYADKVAGSSMEDGLSLIAHAGLTREDMILKVIEDAASVAPLMAHLSITIMSDDGFTEAVIGSIDDDKAGRSIKQAADSFHLMASLLHLFFERIKEKHGITLDGLVAHIMKSPFFPPGREKRLRKGLAAWLDGDPETAIHILVPQVEAACRDLIEAAGISVRKPNKKIGGSMVKGLGDLLAENVFKEGAIKDAGFHLRALYTDPRGINLRNKVCHGIATESLLGIGIANFVVHSILLIADIRVTPKTSG